MQSNIFEAHLKTYLLKKNPKSTITIYANDGLSAQQVINVFAFAIIWVCTEGLGRPRQTCL